MKPRAQSAVSERTPIDRAAVIRRIGAITGGMKLNRAILAVREIGGAASDVRAEAVLRELVEIGALVENGGIVSADPDALDAARRVRPKLAEVPPEPEADEPPAAPSPARPAGPGPTKVVADAAVRLLAVVRERPGITIRAAMRALGLPETAITSMRRASHHLASAGYVETRVERHGTPTGPRDQIAHYPAANPPPDAGLVVPDEAGPPQIGPRPLRPGGRRSAEDVEREVHRALDEAEIPEGSIAYRLGIVVGLLRRRD